jgi:hypothetical protein
MIVAAMQNEAKPTIQDQTGIENINKKIVLVPIKSGLDKLFLKE